MQSKNTLLAYIGLAIVFVGFILWGIQMQFDAYPITALSIGIILLLVYVAQNTSFLIIQLTGRTAVEGANLTVSVIVFLAIAIFVYLLLKQHSIRYDFTEAKKFTLASQSIQLVKKLDQDIVVQFLINPKMPEEQTRVKDLMGLYMRYSNKLSFEIVDPEREPEKVRALAPVSLGAAYVRLGEQHEKVSPINEENLTNAIMKITKGASRKAYFTTGHGEPGIDDKTEKGLLGMKSMLEDEGFEVEAIALYEKDDVPDDCAALVIAGPKRPFLANEVSAIERFLDKGGDALFFIDPETKSGLENVVQKKLGIVLGNDYVVENNAVMRAFGASPLSPMMAKIEEHPIMNAYNGQPQAIMFPKTRSVSISEDAPEDVEVTELIKTSPNSWAETNIKDLFDPSKGTAGYDEGEDTMGPIALAAAATKKIEIADATGDASPDTESTDENVDVKDETPEMRAVVFGDSDFLLNDAYLRSSDLFVNSVNWLVQQEDLISIRAKDDSGKPIMLNKQQVNVVFYLSLFVFPILVALFGTLMVVMKKMRG